MNPWPPEQYFFDVPIYRCSLDQHTETMKKQEKHAQAYLAAMSFGDEASRTKCYNQERARWNKYHWYCWQFNEIVGWIRLYVLMGGQIRGDEFYCSAKRIVARSRAPIQFRGKAFEIYVHREDPNEAIYNKILAALKDMQREPQFKKRFIDTSNLEYLGCFIDWKALLPALRIRKAKA
jgi:hypothetical protein